MTTDSKGHEAGSGRLLAEPAQEWGASLARRLGCPVDDVLRAASRPLVGPYLAEWHSPADPADPAYVDRVARALGYHWWRLEQKRPCSSEEVVRSVRTGRLAYGDFREDVLREVVLAEDYARGGEEAAVRFRDEYVPVIAATARAAGGDYAVQELDGFETELIMPRDGRPPRLSSFAGHSPLRMWLRRVVRREWARICRTPGPILMGTDPMSFPDSPSPSEEPDRRECLKLLEPVFRRGVATLEEEEALLLEMVLLDGRRQDAVAGFLEVNKSTISRRIRRACRKLVAAFRSTAAALKKDSIYEDCLNWLFNAAPWVREGMGEELAVALRCPGEAQPDGDPGSPRCPR